MIELSDGEVASPRDAATVMLVRDPINAPELFMVKRTSKAKFMANAMVFPGGRLDEEDCSSQLVDHCAMGRDEAADRLGMEDGARALGLIIAALRETFEEAGVLLAYVGNEKTFISDPSLMERLKTWRAQLNAGTVSLIDILKAEALTLAVDQLRYFSHWVTPAVEKRRYDTRFFVATAPSVQVPTHDARETTASAWLSAQEALDRYERSEILLAPPTLRVLMDIHQTPSILHPDTIYPQPAPICPLARVEDDRLNLILPGDPEFQPAGSTPNRVILEDGRWVSVGSGSRLLP